MRRDVIISIKVRTYWILRYILLLIMVILPLFKLGNLFSKSYEENLSEVMMEFSYNYDKPFFPGGEYDRTIPRPDSILGYPLGFKPVNYNEVERYFVSLSNASTHVMLKEYGITYEGHTLYYLIISSEDNLSKIDEIKASIAKIADPRKIGNEREAKSLIEKTPAIAWLAYCVHGDELSPTDAAIQVAYQLAAGTDSLTKRLRKELIIIIDPLQNPDGRERYVSQLRQLSGTLINSDAQSLQHSGFWPWGRTNHYLFDLNRDWFSLVHPETRGKIKVILEWNPQLFIDAHEMWSFSTFLFSPPREPFNPNITETVKKWWKIFAHDQANAFDKYGWSYYTRDWYEGWYPGFGSHWIIYTGSIGILYEQAGVDGILVKQPDGNILTYRESVHHHFVSSISNLRTAANNRRELLWDFYKEKRRSIEDKTGNSIKSYIFSLEKNNSRINRFIETLILQGIEAYIAEKDFVASNIYDFWGEKMKEKQFPVGTYIVPLNQPMSPLTQAILEFDPRIPDSFLLEERHELEENKETRIYEVTAWSIPMAYNIDAYWTDRELKVSRKQITQIEKPIGNVINQNPNYGYIIDYSNDAAVNALINLLKNDYNIRVANKPFKIEGITFPRGSILITNRGNSEDIHEFVKKIAEENSITIYGVNTALSEEGPDLGSGQFQLLKLPRIGIFAGSQIDFTSYGTIWYLLDNEYKIHFSSLDINSFNFLDLDKYNILIFPQVWGGPEVYQRLLGNFGVSKLKSWIEQGGTLIAIGTGAAFIADTSIALSNVRLRRQVLDKISDYEKAFTLEISAKKPTIDSKVLWEGVQISKEEPQKENNKDELKESPEEDARLRLFMPRGSILRCDLDNEHWLTSGMKEKVPVILYTEFAFMSKDPVKAVARFADEDKIRLSGLLWPEARKRWARTAYLTREGLGKGQIILFADEPNFRGYFHGSNRLLLNAILLGPGFGTMYTAPW